MENVLRELSEWVTSSLEGVGTKKTTATLFDGPSDDEKVIQEFIFTGRDNPEDFARLIYIRAEKHAHAMGGKNAFQVEIQGVNGVYAFAVDGGDEDESAPAGPPETPDELGASGRLMVGIALDAMTKNNEQLREGFVEVATLFKQTIKDLSQSVREMSSERASVLTLFGELADNKFKRELELRREVRSDERKENLVKMLTPIGGAMLANFMAKQQAAASEGGVVDQLRMVASDMNPEQLAKLQEILTPRQQAGLQGLLRHITTSQPVGGEEEGSPIQ